MPKAGWTCTGEQGQSPALHSMGHVGRGGEQKGKEWEKLDENSLKAKVTALIQLFLPGKRVFSCLTLWPLISRMLLALWIILGLAYLPDFWAQGQRDVRGNYSSGTQEKPKAKQKAFKILLVCPVEFIIS